MARSPEPVKHSTASAIGTTFETAAVDTAVDGVKGGLLGILGGALTGAIIAAAIGAAIFAGVAAAGGSLGFLVSAPLLTAKFASAGAGVAAVGAGTVSATTSLLGFVGSAALTGATYLAIPGAVVGGIGGLVGGGLTGGAVGMFKGIGRGSDKIKAEEAAYVQAGLNHGKLARGTVNRAVDSAVSQASAESYLIGRQEGEVRGAQKLAAFLEQNGMLRNPAMQPKPDGNYAGGGYGGGGDFGTPEPKTVTVKAPTAPAKAAPEIQDHPGGGFGGGGDFGPIAAEDKTKPCCRGITPRDGKFTVQADTDKTKAATATVQI